MNVITLPHRFDAFGRDPALLDRVQAEIHEIVVRYARRRQFARDYWNMRKACRVNGRWIACQVDAGMFGDEYAGMYLLDAVEHAKRCWREIRAEERG